MTLAPKCDCGHGFTRHPTRGACTRCACTWYHPNVRAVARKKRAPSEFARIYGSRERVQWIKSFGCALCGYPGAVNAHTVTGGTGRKAGYETIVPLCDAHHRAYDEHRWPFDDEAVRDAMKSAAARLDRLWQERAA